jgi:hypothetical protein
MVEALRLKTDKMETIPIAVPTEATRSAIQQLRPVCENWQQAGLKQML